MEEEVDVHYQLRYDNAAKAHALDQLLADIKAGLVRIVPVEPTSDIASALDFTAETEEYEEYNRNFHDVHGTAQELNRLYWKGSWQAALKSAPEYEPLKEWL